MVYEHDESSTSAGGHVTLEMAIDCSREPRRSEVGAAEKVESVREKPNERQAAFAELMVKPVPHTVPKELASGSATSSRPPFPPILPSAATKRYRQASEGERVVAEAATLPNSINRIRTIIRPQDMREFMNRADDVESNRSTEATKSQRARYGQQDYRGHSDDESVATSASKSRKRSEAMMEA